MYAHVFPRIAAPVRALPLIAALVRALPLIAAPYQSARFRSLPQRGRPLPLGNDPSGPPYRSALPEMRSGD